MYTYDGKVMPQSLGGTSLHFDTVVVALVTVVRVSMGNIVEAGISQGKWVWCSARRREDGKKEVARLGDLVVFDEASRDAGPALSTKAAVYSGIISNQIPVLAAQCETGNCSWPIIPTLAACGECGSIPVYKACNETAKTCNYTTSTTSLTNIPTAARGFSQFSVTPTNGTLRPMNATDQSYFSVFEMLSVTQSEDEGTMVSGSECALWFCIQAYSISVNAGVQNESMVANWSTTALRRGGAGSHGAEHVFVNMTADTFNMDNGTRFAVTHEAMEALRGFMASITQGTVYADAGTIDSSSDWVEAMWNATDQLGPWIATLAAGLTADIRQHGTLSGAGAGRYNGYATQLMPYVKVQWFLFFLFYTIKSGILPLLFCRVDERIRDRVGDGMDEPGGVGERVGHIGVALYRAEDGQWGFRAVEGVEGMV
ncbi:hypothetical protein QBC47DRAFT_423380 [Echria macrotheca]|uniref:Uncharacterized protein n=1 Tax=Echria macrotheca TaxID=438768 RepID=A0AAJ0BC14_9PEZI|nr:hypothetical protein QBC47DRAFT_423380 [Echria macrotheca]